jgi:3-hydroxyisobutyrate dehydrogenase
MKIGYLGTGLLGSSIVRRLIANGHELTVWNRSPDKASALAAHGAKAVRDPAEAVAGMEQVHLTVSDDASVDAVLEPLADRIAPGTWIVDHTTTAPSATGERVARWSSRGKRFVHAPVFMSPAAALQGQGAIVVSGRREWVEALRPTLAAMTGQVIEVGEDPGRAAAFKLFGNLMIIGAVGLMADVNRLAKACGVASRDALGLFESFNPGASIPARAAKLGAQDFAPSFEATMARKDLRLMMEEAARGGIELELIPRVAALLDSAIGSGHGDRDVVVAAALP